MSDRHEILHGDPHGHAQHLKNAKTCDWLILSKDDLVSQVFIDRLNFFFFLLHPGGPWCPFLQSFCEFAIFHFFALAKWQWPIFPKICFSSSALSFEGIRLKFCTETPYAMRIRHRNWHLAIRARFTLAD